MYILSKVIANQYYVFMEGTNIDIVETKDVRTILAYGVSLDSLALDTNNNIIVKDPSKIDQLCEPYLIDSNNTTRIFGISEFLCVEMSLAEDGSKSIDSIRIQGTDIEVNLDISYMKSKLDTLFDSTELPFNEDDTLEDEYTDEAIDLDEYDEAVDFDDLDDIDDLEDMDDLEDTSAEDTDANLYETCKLVSKSVLEIVKSDNPHSSAVAEYNNSTLTSADVGLCFFFDLHTDIDDERDRLDIQIRSFAEEELTHSYLYDNDIIDVDKVYETAKSLLDSFLADIDDLEDTNDLEDLDNEELDNVDSTTEEDTDTEEDYDLEDDFDEYDGFDSEYHRDKNADFWEVNCPGVEWDVEEEQYYYRGYPITLPKSTTDFSNPRDKLSYFDSFNFAEYKAEETGTEDKESIESTLYGYLTEEQISLLQQYYLYMSQYIFKLDRGDFNLTVKRTKDLDDLKKDASHTWHYAGFIDMGYAGTSVCPSCGSKQRSNALSSCCGFPIYAKKALKDENGKVLYDEYGEKVYKWQRTYNGVCLKCGKTCSVVTDTVGVRKIDRSHQNGIKCAVCSNDLKQSNHYCTFNDPVRYMHLAWDVTNSDLEKNFFGQLVNQDINSLIENPDCIKFGLNCVSQFFDIAPKSEAFVALQNIQKTCIKDMDEMEEIYAKQDAELIQTINSSFELLDSLAPLLKRMSTKFIFLQKDPILPGNILDIYMKMRETNMVIPRSMIQFIRDFILDWRVHKFIDNTDYYSYRASRIGSIAGNDNCNSKKANTHHVRLAEVLNGLFGNQSATTGVLLRSIYDENNPHKIDEVEEFVLCYLTAIFTYKICGCYQYNALEYTDEGGRSKDETGVHYKVLDAFYRQISRLSKTAEFFKYNVDEVKKVLAFYNQYCLVKSFIEGRSKELKVGTLRTKMAEKDGISFDKYIYSDEPIDYLPTDIIEQYNADLGTLFKDSIRGTYFTFDNFTYRLFRYDKHSIEEVIQILENYWSLLNSKFEDLKNYIKSNLVAEAERKSNESFEKAKQVNEKRLREAEEARIQEEAKRQEEYVKSQQDTTSVVVSSSSSLKTPKEVVDFLSNEDLSSVSFNDSDKAKDILKSVLKGSGYPTQKQFYYIRKLYEEYSGQKYSGIEPGSEAKKNLSDIEHLESALDWVEANSDTITDEKFKAICRSLKQYKTVSVRQEPYADKAVEMYKTANGL